MSANAAQRLLQHYVDNFRRLPWRSPPGEPPPDPYRVWLSEIMLQQTTVAAVAPRFERFVRRWPDIAALAAARDADVLGEWAGLGYYARARNLIACARRVVELGDFPSDEAGLLKLPGVGPYTAAAIAAIAFGRHCLPVDTNIERIAARLFALREVDGAAARRLLSPWLPKGQPGDFAQALMDLGATICRPRRPRCDSCPLSGECAAFASGQVEDFPAPRRRRERPKRFATAWWIERGDSIWLVRRPPGGLLGGMAALPGPEWTDRPPPARATLAAVRHQFTHFTLELAIERRACESAEGWWQPLETLSGAGLPTLYRRAVAAVLAARRPLAA